MSEPMAIDVIRLGLNDWVSLPEVVTVVRRYNSDDGRIFADSIKLVKQMVLDGLIEVGDLTGEGGRFRRWSLDIDDTIKEIEQRWIKSDGPFDKNTGEIVCWLSNTSKGDGSVR